MGFFGPVVMVALVSGIPSKSVEMLNIISQSNLYIKMLTLKQLIVIFLIFKGQNLDFFLAFGISERISLFS